MAFMQRLTTTWFSCDGSPSTPSAPPVDGQIEIARKRRLEHRDRVARDGVEIDGLDHVAAAPAEREQLGREIGRTPRRGQDRAQALATLAAGLVVEQQVGVAHVREHVVEVVRHTTGQAPRLSSRCDSARVASVVASRVRSAR
jgi:hypothetical protein